MKALCMAGGGAHGILALGAYHAYLEKYGDYNGLFGTSVGSLNGILIHQGELDKAIDLWKHVKNSDIFTWNPLKMFGSSASLADSKPLAKLIDQYINLDLLSKNPRKFYVTATCIATAKPETRVLPCADMAQWILASASAPIAFPVQTINNVQYTDGGPTSNYNLRVAIDDGYDEIILICPSNMQARPIKNLLDMLAFQMQVQGAIQLNDETGLINLLNKSKHTVAATIYAPEAPLDFGPLDFNKASANYERYFNIGYGMIKKPVVQFRKVLQAGAKTWMIYK